MWISCNLAREASVRASCSCTRTCSGIKLIICVSVCIWAARQFASPPNITNKRTFITLHKTSFSLLVPVFKSSTRYRLMSCNSSKSRVSKHINTHFEGYVKKKRTKSVSTHIRSVRFALHSLKFIPFVVHWQFSIPKRLFHLMDICK